MNAIKNLTRKDKIITRETLKNRTIRIRLLNQIVATEQLDIVIIQLH